MTGPKFSTTANIVVTCETLFQKYFSNDTVIFHVTVSKTFAKYSTFLTGLSLVHAVTSCMTDAGKLPVSPKF